MKTVQIRKSLEEITEIMDRNETAPAFFDIMIEAGYMLGCAARYDQAESCFRAVLALCENRVGGLLGLGNVLLMQGKIQESEEIYERVLESDPSDPAARAFLGELYLCTGRIREGREILESVHQDFPDSRAGHWAWNLLVLSREIVSCTA